MWMCFWRRRGRVFRLIYLVCLLGFIAISKDYILYGDKNKKPLRLQHSIVQSLQDWGQEKQRLHDFLNQIKTVCKMAKHVGEESMTLPVCLETKHGKKLVEEFSLISVESKNLSFEREIEIYWKKAKVLRVASENDENLFEKLEKTLKNASGDDEMILKLSNYASIKPDLIRKLAENRLLEHVRMLFIYLHLKANHSLLFNWYSVLVSLNLNLDFALYHVSNNLKTCLDNLKTSDCTITTSWLKQPSTGVVFPQITSPDSELAALLFNLLTQTHNCSTLELFNATINVQNKRSSLLSYIQTKRWPLCKSLSTEPCIVYSANFGYTQSAFINSMLSLFCAVHIFDPVLKYETSKGNLYFHQWGFAAKNNSVFYSVDSKDQKWLFKTVTETRHELGHQNTTIDVLHLDLHGGEWEVLKEMISSRVLEHVTQIIATIHVWYGEEYFNHLGQFLTLQKLHDLGFDIYFAEPMVDASNTLQFVTPTEQCCLTIGWMKSEIKRN